ncbi:MAG: glycosyltransferase family 2 protein [Phycisphaeraceae bacterium]|nr:glycosyltransferase family 2 protein [Phycisphaeraceae bacterium]
MSISVVIHTLNSERYLEQCLGSVRGADEIIICDMHSTDRTLEIAARYGCRIIHHPRLNHVSPARNFAIGHAKCDWVFVVDSDEVTPPELWDYLVRYTADPDAADALRIPRKNFALGRFLWCWYPTLLIRFWRRGCADWSPPRVHSVPKINGRIDSIDPRRTELAILHYNFDSIEQYIAQMNKYTTLEIEKFRLRGEKFSALKMIGRGVCEFFKLLICRRGYRDGVHGLVFIAFSAFYQFLAMAKLWEAELRDRERAATCDPNAPPADPPAAPTPVTAAAGD